MRKLREQRNALDYPINGRGEVPTGFRKQTKLAVAARHSRAVAERLVNRHRLAALILGGGKITAVLPRECPKPNPGKEP